MQYKRAPRRFRKAPKKSLSTYQAKTVARIARKAVKRQAEHKYAIILDTSESIDYSGILYHLTPTTQGTSDVSHRIGDTIQLTNIEFMGATFYGDTYNLVRFIMFQWKDNSIPVISDVLIGTYVGTAEAVHSPFNHDTRKKFKILYDTTYVVSEATNQQAKLHHYKKSFKNCKVQYEAQASTAPYNGVYCIWISDSGAVAHPHAEFIAKMTFIDT